MGKYDELAARVGAPESKIIPKLFQMIADETEAEILLALPATVPELAGKLHLPVEELESRINDLFLKGLVFRSRKTSPPTYRMSRNLEQFHDATVLWKEAPREFLDLWQEWMETEWPVRARETHKKLTTHPARIIPVKASIEIKPNVMNFESVSQLIKNARSLAVTNCTCRLHARKCDRPLETCIQLNASADYNIERGTGRKIDAEEALAIFERAAAAGLVTTTMNQREVATYICNCCPCCCQALHLFIKTGIPITAPARYQAVIDGATCIGCGTCHERCYFGAISWAEGEGSTSVVAADRCMGCGLCQITCPTGAIELVAVRPEEFVPEKFVPPNK